MNQPWTVVLAAGAGRRLAGVTGGVPKQYWRPEGGATLLEDTVARLGSLSVPEQTITVAGAGHRPYIELLTSNWSLGEVLYQPADRGTATGVLLGLGAVAAIDPDAVVVITPSDHGVEDAAFFRHTLWRAVARIRRRESRIVLFGSEAAEASTDLGWITPAAPSAAAPDAFQRVIAFVEKPALPQAIDLFDAGAVWNTMVVAARVQALIDLYRRFLPFHLDVITEASGLEPGARERFLHDWYDDLAAADFCRDVLAPAANLWLYIWPAEMGWSDLGTPERLRAWLTLQRRPTLTG